MAGILDIKTINFRLIGVDGTPLTWAFIEAYIAPQLSNAYLLNTTLTPVVTTRTNEYGIGVLTLLANDTLELPLTKYLIKITYNGRSYYFTFTLTKVMNDVLDFESLVDHAAINALQQCQIQQQNEGVYKISGTKPYL